MNEQTLIKAQNFLAELQQLVNQGKSLREISKITYERREAGDDIPYMAIGSTRNGEAVYIYAKPIVKQKEWKTFFEIPRQKLKVFPITLCIEKKDTGEIAVELKL